MDGEAACQLLLSSPSNHHDCEVCIPGLKSVSNGAPINQEGKDAENVDHEDAGFDDEELPDAEDADTPAEEEAANAELPDADGSSGSEPSDDSSEDNFPDDDPGEGDPSDDGPPGDDPSGDEPSGDDTNDESEHEPLFFDPDGDLRLVIGTGRDRVTCLVCSKALARASPVFKSMLFGGFAESKPRDASTQWVVNLPEDDINAMAILLHIFHGQVNQVPIRLPEKRGDLFQAQLFNYYEPAVAIDVLYRITVVSDKYFVTPLLKPWAKSWIHQCRSIYCEDFARLMWIAWVLGDRPMLISELEKLVLLSELGPDGKTLGLTDVLLTHRIDDFSRPGDGPEVILSILNISEKIRSARAVAMKAILDPVRIYLDDPLVLMGPKCAWHMEAAGPGSDREAILTAFRETLAQCHLYPLPDPPETWDSSAIDLQGCLMQATIDCSWTLMNRPLQHIGCSPLERLIACLTKVLKFDRPLMQLDSALKARLKQRQLETGV